MVGLRMIKAAIAGERVRETTSEIKVAVAIVSANCR